MRAFAYVAYTAEGRRRTGTQVAETEADASEQLRARGLHVAELGPARTRRGLRRARFGAELRTVFTRQMAVLLSADLPVEAALEAAREGGHPALDAIAAEARAALMDGAPLSRALARSGGGFPAYYVAAIRAGETAGALADVFSALADHLETQGGERAQIATALVYPAFVAAVALLVCGILLVSVAPEIVGLYAQADRPLPSLTQAVLAVADTLGAQALPILGTLAAIAAGLAAAPRVPALRHARDRVALRIPVTGRLMRLQASVQYMRTLALVLHARHTVPAAVDSARDVLPTARFRDEGAAALLALRQGESLSSALGRLSFLPPVARQLIAAGEASARVARMTDRAAVLVEQRLSAERRRIAALLEPALMILVGGLVLVIVLAVLLPIFDLQAVVAG